MFVLSFFFFFQAEDGIRDAQESRGLGDVYKRQALGPMLVVYPEGIWYQYANTDDIDEIIESHLINLSLIHI